MAVIAPSYNGSFDSVGFMLLVPLVRPPTVSNETQYHIVSTDDNVTIDLGKGMRNWSQKVAVDAANLATLEAKVGNTASYVFCDGTISSTRLKGIDGVTKAPGWATYELTLQLAVDN